VDIFLWIGVVGIVLLLLFLYKWLPNSNKNKIERFINMLNTLTGSYTKEMVIKALPYAPTAARENTLIYNISALTSGSMDAGSVSHTTSNVHVELMFQNNYLVAIFRVSPNGEKVLLKKF